MMIDEAIKRQIENYWSVKKYVAGVDEVARGALFGPVVTAAVILPIDFFHPEIDDSKKCSQSRRKRLADIIKANAVSYSIQENSPQEIDRINITNATLVAMQKAIHSLIPQPAMVFVDGNVPIPNLECEQRLVIKGDSSVLSIACASILAKNYTDELMTKLDDLYPGYDLKASKGYGSPKHLEGLQKYGITDLHRKTYETISRALSITIEKKIRLKK